MTYIPYLGTFFSHGTPVWPWPVIYMYCYNIRILNTAVYIYMNIRERPKIYYSMRTISIELAYALCLVSPWMHNRSVTRAGATSSYKLQLVAET